MNENVCRGRHIWCKRGMLAILTLCLAAGGAGAALADEREDITEINLDIEADIEAGSSYSGDVEVTTDDSSYTVDGAEVTNFDGDWSGGEKPEVEIILYAEDGYKFATSREEAFSFSGVDAEFVSAHREDDNTVLRLKIRLEPVEQEDLTVGGAYWDEEYGTARWNENPNARYYQLRLYRGDRQIASVTTQRDTSDSYGFAREITTAGSYYFEVCAVGSGSAKGDWVSSDTWNVSSEEAKALQASGSTRNSEEYGEYGGKQIREPEDSMSGPGSDEDEENAGDQDDSGVGPGWKGSSSSSSSSGNSRTVSSADSSRTPNSPGTVVSSDTAAASGGQAVQGASSPDAAELYTSQTALASGTDGSWEKDEWDWKFKKTDGTYVTGCWQLVDGLWYCFDGTGYLRYGWIPYQGKQYYCGSSGAMLVNAKTPDNQFVGGDGALIQ